MRIIIQRSNGRVGIWKIQRLHFQADAAAAKGCSYLSEGTVIEEEFTLADPQMAVSLFGINDAYLKLIEEGKNVIVSSFGDHVKIKGSQDDVSETKEIFAQLAELLKKALRSAMLTLFRR